MTSKKDIFKTKYSLLQINQKMSLYEEKTSKLIEIENTNDLIIKFGNLISQNKEPFQILSFNVAETVYQHIADLSDFFNFKLLASNSVNWYFLDLCDLQDKILFRIFDVSKLTLTNSFDELEELLNYTFEQDVDFHKSLFQFLNLLLEHYPFLVFEDFGNSIFTQTSILRQYQERVVGNLKYTTDVGQKIKYNINNRISCQREKFKSYKEYGMAKACFRGGLSFVSPLVVHKMFGNVQKLDITSCYHAFISGKRIPVKFKELSAQQLNYACCYIQGLTVEDILSNYSEPFNYYFNAKIKFKNLKLKKNSYFDFLKIATLSTEKFNKFYHSSDEVDNNERRTNIEFALKNNGYYDNAKGFEFAFGKIYSADECELYITEHEFWLICQCYSFDNYECMEGFGTINTNKPPSLQIMTSVLLFNEKEKLKKIKNERNTIVDNINYDMYKRLYNSLFGIQVQDPFNVNYEFNKLFCSFDLNLDNLPNFSNFEELNKKTYYKNIYNYGSRISASSRINLYIAIYLILNKYKEDVVIMSGDTDSLSVSTHKNVTAQNLINALEPLHQSIEIMLRDTMHRVVMTHLDVDFEPYFKKIGKFIIEKENIKYHFEFWNKARCSFNQNLILDLTLSGVPQPDNLPNLSTKIQEIVNKNKNEIIKNPSKLEEIVNNIIGYNTYLDYDVCFKVEQDVPKLREKKAIEYKKGCLVLGDLSKKSNLANLKFLNKINRKDIRTEFRQVNQKGVYDINGNRIL